MVFLFYDDFLRQENVIICGDFNSNLLWKKKHGIVTDRDHKYVIEYLGLNNIYSSYHHYFNEEQYERLEKSIDSEIDNCNQLILEKENEIDSTKNGVVWFDWLEDFKNHYNKIKDIKSIDQKRDFIRQFVEKIKVYWDKETKTHKLIITFRLKIVKDKRIRREKNVYRLQNGQTDKVISNFNSIKYKRLLKKKKESNLLVDSYSTVIGYFTTNTSSPESSNKENVDEILVSFNLVVKSSNLTKSSHYNTYQHKLYRLIKFLKEERGIGYRRISHILTEKGYRSVRTNSILKNNYIHSIYKKGKIRENRINREFDCKIENLKYIFKFSD